MAVASTMVDIGSPLPSFALRDVAEGREYSDDAFTGRALVVVFLCRHCPYVKRIADGLGAFSRDVAGAGVSVVGIASNDVTSHPEDSPASLAEFATERGFQFPILFDEDQAVARAFQAACTPDFFVYGPDRTLAYRGQFDASRPSNDVPSDGSALHAAVDAVLAGRAVPEPQVPSLGCSIKWKPGNQPELTIQRHP
jgi:peroxiredoxin